MAQEKQNSTQWKVYFFTSWFSTTPEHNLLSQYLLYLSRVYLGRCKQILISFLIFVFFFYQNVIYDIHCSSLCFFHLVIYLGDCSRYMESFLILCCTAASFPTIQAPSLTSILSILDGHCGHPIDS